MTKSKYSPIVRLIAISVIAFFSQTGCSEDGTDESALEQSGGYGAELIGGSAGSDLPTAGVGGSAFTDSADSADSAGGASGGISLSAGTGGAADASTESVYTGGESAAGSSGAAGEAGSSGQSEQGENIAGSSGATSEAGSGGQGGQDETTPGEEDACGADATTPTGTTEKVDYGLINLYTSGTNEFIGLTTTMIVPSEPEPRNNTLFLWPGLEPLANNGTFEPVGLGVLQPVLTWGSSCGGNAGTRYDSWWIQAMYVNVNYRNREFSGCHGGDSMVVEIGDKLDMEIVLNGTIWSQFVTNQSNGESVTFDIDLEGQQQVRTLFEIETIDNQSFILNPPKPTDDVIFLSTTLALKEPESEACVPGTQGMNDYFSPPRVSSDGKTCCFSKIILRAEGIAASSPNTP